MPEFDFTPTDRPRGVSIASAVKVDFEPIRSGVEVQVDAFIAECEQAATPTPDRQAMIDRAESIVANLDPTAPDGINSLAANKRIVFVHKEQPPYFAATTEG